jgi:hypothetical protein
MRRVKEDLSSCVWTLTYGAAARDASEKMISPSRRERRRKLIGEVRQGTRYDGR